MSEVATKVRPMGDRILIRPESREEKTKSGLVLPDTAKEKPMEGIVQWRSAAAASPTTATWSKWT